MKRLVWLTECVHGYEGVCSFGDCPGGQTEIAEADTQWLCHVRDEVRNSECAHADWAVPMCRWVWVVEAGK